MRLSLVIARVRNTVAAQYYIHRCPELINPIAALRGHRMNVIVLTGLIGRMGDQK
jgi:hypothetical protein